MWYFLRKGDNKEFMLTRIDNNYVFGVAYDGERCCLEEGMYANLRKR
jgi:hypothetical protein